MSTLKISGLGKDLRADYVLVKFKTPAARTSTKRSAKPAPFAREPAAAGRPNKQPEPIDVDYWVRVSLGLARSNKGRTPWSAFGLLSKLETTMRQFPEYFPHVVRKPIRMKLAEWTEIFPYLLADFGANIVDRNILDRLGYGQLVYYMGQHPDRFPVPPDLTYVRRKAG